MKPLAAAALAAVLTAAGCAAGPHGGPTRSLVVEGWAPLQASGRPDALRRAVADAQRRAVEQAGGVEIAAISLIDDALMSRQRLSSTTRGTVRRFKVLEERTEDGMLKVQVRAEVELESKDSPRKPGWTPGTGPKAYLSVLAGDEKIEAEAQAAFLRAWTSYGGEAAQSPADADLSLRISVETRIVPEPRVKPFVSVRARVSMSATPAAGGGAQWAVAREASALGLDEIDARARAIEAAAAAAAEAAAQDLPSRLWLQARVAGRP